MTQQFEGTIAREVSDSTPWWPEPNVPPPGTPSIVVILLDDTGFAHLNCFGSLIDTPNFDRLAARGLRYNNFHTTALCSPSRACLLTGRNHHSVGMRAVSNFDTGFPNMRGRIAHSAATISELLQENGWSTFCVGKWHLAPMREASAAGPYDDWPLRRGFDRFYGFMQGETDHFHPELYADNHLVDAPGRPEDGYHLSEDLVDQAIGMVRNQLSLVPERPFFLYLPFGATHAPHQAPDDYLAKYRGAFDEGWDVWRDRIHTRQLEMGIIPEGTELAPRNPGVRPWDELDETEQAFACRLQEAFAAFLDHTDAQVGRLLDALDELGVTDDTLIFATSDNGASQEGNETGVLDEFRHFNGVPEDMGAVGDRLDDIGTRRSFTNYPWGWAQVGNTPAKRYKQNTHGGGVRDPLVVSWPAGISDAGALRHQFAHVSDVVPTLLELLEIEPPAEVNGVAQQPIEGTSFLAAVNDGDAATGKQVQYFEMFSHRGIWIDGWKAVAYHAPGTPIDDDVWELYDLRNDFNEIHDLAAAEPQRLADMIERWWAEAEANQVLPLDDRFGERFAENAARVHGDRLHYEFWSGMGHLPTDVAPDLRSRSYRIVAEVEIPETGADGVLVAHGDATSGYSLYLDGGYLVHDLNIGGSHQVVRSDRAVVPGRHDLAFRMDRAEGVGTGTLEIDGVDVGSMTTTDTFFTMISFSGLDIGLDRSSPVGRYDAPNVFTGTLRRVKVDMVQNQDLDHEAAGRVQLARE